MSKGAMLNRTHNENCLDTMGRMPDEFIDLTVTSPPYDDLRDYKGYTFEFEKIAKELFRVTKQGGVVVWVIGDRTANGSETGTSFRQALYFKDEVGFNLFDTMIYSKTVRPAVGNPNGYWQSFEYMFVLSKGSPKTINLIKDRENITRSTTGSTKRLADGSLKKVARSSYEGKGRRTNVWFYPVGHRMASDRVALKHPAIFPEALAGDHILSWSNEGDIVYDPFMGSGTTAKMAIEHNRQWVGSEISSEYCQIIEKRLASVQLKLTDTQK